MEFCAHESCGKCTPCRIGSVRGVEVIDHIREAGDNAQERAQYIDLLEDLCATMEDGSLCAMGGLTPSPVRSALHHYLYRSTPIIGLTQSLQRSTTCFSHCFVVTVVV